MGHTFSNVLLHVVFSTKDRAPLIRDTFRDRLYPFLGGIARKEFGKAIEIGGTDNHVHALLSMRMDVAISDAMSKFKSQSSGWVHRTFPDEERFAWQGGYGAFSVSESQADKVVKYIKEQAEHHRKMSFEEEFVRLLKRHKIEYDPTTIWD